MSENTKETFEFLGYFLSFLGTLVTAVLGGIVALRVAKLNRLKAMEDDRLLKGDLATEQAYRELYQAEKQRRIEAETEARMRQQQLEVALQSADTMTRNAEMWRGIATSRKEELDRCLERHRDLFGD